MDESEPRVPQAADERCWITGKLRGELLLPDWAETPVLGLKSGQASVVDHRNDQEHPTNEGFSRQTVMNFGRSRVETKNFGVRRIENAVSVIDLHQNRRLSL